MGVVVVVPEPVEEALTMEGVMYRLMVLKGVVLMPVVVWTPEVAVHEKHEDPLQSVGYTRRSRTEEVSFSAISSLIFFNKALVSGEEHLWSWTVEAL